MSDHALLSASGSYKWLFCSVSLLAEKGMADRSSVHAEAGSVFHELMRCALRLARDPALYLGAKMRVVNGKVFSIKGAKNQKYDGDLFVIDRPITSDNTYIVDREMVDHAHESTLKVLEYLPVGCKKYIETKVDFSKAIGVPGSFGTLDVAGINGKTLVIWDHKWGLGVKVSAYKNPQLMLYALAMLEYYGRFFDIDKIQLIVNQPRVSGEPSVWECSVNELLDFGKDAYLAAQKAIAHYNREFKGAYEVSQFYLENATPGKEQCRWCKAKGTCPALAKKAFDLISEDFVDLTKEDEIKTKINQAVADLPTMGHNHLAVMMQGLPLLEIFIKGVREAAFVAALQGKAAPGTKMVQGREGRRKWKDEDGAAAKMKSFNIKEADIYEPKSLVSVAQAEKRFAKRPNQWKEMEEFFTRSKGKLSIALADDPRPEAKPEDLSGDFENLEEGNE